jgi:hypothetical protein
MILSQNSLKSSLKPGRILAVISVMAMAAPLTSVNPKPAFSQAAVQLVQVDVALLGKGYRASKLIGSKVTNDKKEEIGKIDDIIVDRERVLFAVLQVGGFLGVGGRLIAIPTQSLVIDETGGKIQLPGATKDELKKLAEFKYRK